MLILALKLKTLNEFQSIQKKILNSILILIKLN